MIRTQYNVTRKAFLFAAPGGIANNTKWLNGTLKDIENIKRHLRSERGGAWYDNEIVIVQEASFEIVNMLLDSVNADYVFVYFSGHGCTDFSGIHHIALQNRLVTDKSLLCDHIQKQLVIIDSCSDYKDLSGIGSIGGIDTHWKNATSDISITRQMFDEQIYYSPEGKQIIHAVPPGYMATDTIFGGVFTNNLLRTCNYKFEPSDEYKMAGMPELVACMNHPENRRNNLPCYFSVNEGELLVPFAFSLPQQNEKQIPQRHTPQVIFNQPSVNWNHVGIAALFFTALVAQGNTK